MKIKKHIPNILSSLRLLSPLVLIPLLITGKYAGAFIALCAFLSTDAVDGYLARKWQVQSALGAKIDAFADKIILASLLIPLIFSHPYILVNLGLEGSISLVNVFRSLKGGKPKTLQIGRVKMIAISLFMALSYLSNLILVPKWLLPILFTLTTHFQLKTLISYYNEYQKEQREQKIADIKNEITRINEEEKDKKMELKNEFDKNLVRDCKEDLIQEDELSQFEKLQLNKKELREIREELINFKRNNLNNGYSKIKIKQ